MSDPLAEYSLSDLNVLTTEEQRNLLGRIHMQHSFTMVYCESLSDDDVTDMLQRWISSRTELMFMLDDHQLPRVPQVSYSSDRFRALFDMVLMMMNRLSIASVENQSSTEELILGLEKQIKDLKTIINELEPKYYASSSEDESSPSTPTKRPRLVESGNSTIGSTSIVMI